ncbi:MAG: EAL domain-containing protein, partial [Candidatus Falkowbacteria bacterium]|nr:EAL domain-containing protein [Candidatus Falkowbacteria bacterium]
SQIITEEMIEKMQILKSMRIRFNLDDFGTEFSNLRSLGRLPIDALKVDQSFTRDTTKTEPKIRRDALTLIKTIGNMADGLDLKTIVEGVETKDQLHVINAMGFEIFQGYFFHRPLVPSEIERLFKNQ